MSTARTYWRTAGEQTTVALVPEPGTITDEHAGPLQVRRRPRLRVPGALTVRGTHPLFARLAVLGGGLAPAAVLAVALVAGGSQERSVRDASAGRDSTAVVDERTDHDADAPTSSRSDTETQGGARRTETGYKAPLAPDTDESSAHPVDLPTPASQAPSPAPTTLAAPAPTETATDEPTPSAPVPAEQSSASDFSFGARDSAAAP